MSPLYDPAFVIQPLDHPNLAHVLTAEPGGVFQVEFRGVVFPARAVAGNPIEIGDLVSFIDMGSEKYIIRRDSGYPTRWIREIADWAQKFPANLFLKYILRANPKDATYHLGTAIEEVSGSVLKVRCWDDSVRDLPVEYAGSPRPASGIVAGAVVMLFQKNPGQWVVIARAGAAIFVAPASLDFPETAFGNSSDPLSVTVTSSGIEADITVSVAGNFQIAASASGPWGASLTLPATGGTLYARFNAIPPTGAKTGNITLSSGTTSATIALTASAVPGAAGIFVDPTSIVFAGDYNEWHPVEVVGNGLSEDIYLEVLDWHFGLALTPGNSVEGFLYLPPTGGTVYVTFGPGGAVGEQVNGVISLSSSGETAQVNLFGINFEIFLMSQWMVYQNIVVVANGFYDFPSWLEEEILLHAWEIGTWPPPPEPPFTPFNVFFRYLGIGTRFRVEIWFKVKDRISGALIDESNHPAQNLGRTRENFLIQTQTIEVSRDNVRMEFWLKLTPI